MRRSFLLCLVLLAACQGRETDDRLKKVEKDLADIKANPPVEKMEVPAPPPAPPPPPTPVIHEEHALAASEVEALVHDQMAAFVPNTNDPYAGAVLQVHPGVVYLYRFLSGWYIPMAQVDEKVLLGDGKISVTPEQMERLHERLAMIVRDSVTTSGAIPGLISADDASRLVGTSSGFISTPTRSNEGFYCVFDRQIALYRWKDEVHAYHLDFLMADYRSLGGPVPVTQETIAAMRAKL